ncbi:hypothetical protein DACRYDRAFT_108421 [Dacryopinax primogenitus]|uniref:CSC1/OSCA1-like 7TM region domain-containing protein n=1 Tax=Dacryopinax primogenitus (strain DJM 731) TaxID=1858805 RepID=M5FTU8_DACPD|nr:uncharacterized protein DACRYDRAFT_108421 [Dacryopinax primogenitus]EJU01091.1 hypothetical protein DACRYDRAFT_108421 [Dacryopinax primogenitus]
MDSDMRYPDNIISYDDDTETCEETSPRHSLHPAVYSSFRQSQVHVIPRIHQTAGGVGVQNWWTTSGTVVLLPTDASSLSVQSLSSIASVAAVSGLNSESTGVEYLSAQPTTTTIFSGSDPIATARLAPDVVTLSDGGIVTSTLLSTINPAENGTYSIYAVKETFQSTTATITTSAYIGTSDGRLGKSTEVPVSTLISGTLTTTFFTESPLPSSDSSTTPPRNGTYVPYTFTSGTSLIATSSFSLLAASSSPSAVGSYSSGPGTVPVCAGQGVDNATVGVLASLALCALLGLLLWGAFALIRPHFPQIYAVRSWFPPTASRPPPLRDSLFSFLNPPVPLVPDVRSAVNTPTADTFPSDEQLAQRVLFVALRIVLGWSVLGIAGCIPLYTVNTPCLGETGVMSFYGGRLSTLTDLSVVRLLELLDADEAGSAEKYPPSSSLSSRTLHTLRPRDIPGSTTSNVRTRLIILAVIVLVLAVFPALWHLIREHRKLTRLRQAFVQVRCGGLEMGWLAVGRAPGLRGLGEGRVKATLERAGVREEERKRGLHSGVPTTAEVGARVAESTAAERGIAQGDRPQKKVDVSGVFTVVDTAHLRGLIKQRDHVLRQLEEAETRYIYSFRLEEAPAPIRRSTTPQDAERGALVGAPPRRRLSKRQSVRSHVSTRPSSEVVQEPRAQLISPSPPSDFLAPSAFYKITSAPHSPTSSSPDEEWNLNRQVTGSRFRELLAHHGPGPFAIGEKIRIGDKGQLRAVTPSLEAVEVDTSKGPNYPSGQNGQEPWEDRGNGMQAVAEEEEGEGERKPQNAESSTQRHPIVLRGGTPDTPATGLFSRIRRRFPQLGHQRNSSRTDQAVTSAQGARGSTFHPRQAGTSRMEEKALLVPIIAKPEDYTQHLSLGAEGVEDAPLPEYAHQPHLWILPHANLAGIYADIKSARSELKRLNTQIEEAQGEAFKDIAKGQSVKGWILLGRGIRWLHGVQMIEGRSKEDVRWDELQAKGTGIGRRVAYWTAVITVAFLLGVTIVPVSGLALSDAPDFAHNLPFLNDLTADSLGPALAITLAPALAATLFVFIAVAVVTFLSRFSGSPSSFGTQFITFRATFFILTIIAGIWLVTVSALLLGLEAFKLAWNQAGSVADGSIYIAVLALTIILNLACIAPALLLINIPRLWKVRRGERKAVTPRQRFRAMYPHFYNYAHATSFCVVGIIIAATFTLLFPLIGPAIVLLLLLSCVAHRFLIGYVYQRGGQTGGLLQMWMLRRFMNLLGLQPVLLGLLLFSRQEWAIGAVLIGVGLGLVLLVEFHTVCNEWKIDRTDDLDQESLRALASFHTAISDRREASEEVHLVPVCAPQSSVLPEVARPRRGSIASILDMMAVTLPVMPSSRRSQEIPLATEHIDDLVSTVRAAHTHPNATEVPDNEPGEKIFEDPAEETAGLLYSPELLAPVPIIWLPDDGEAGVARAEAYDLQQYHGLLTILDDPPRQTRT